jgi:hypothetical protein
MSTTALPSTVADVVATMPAKTFASRAAFRRALFRQCVRVTCCEPCDVPKDRAGNCPVCGEAGRCSGYHFLSEITSSNLLS